MHTSEETFDQILVHVAQLMKESNQLKSSNTLDKKALNQYYSTLTTEFFAIVSLLKTDLYREKKGNVDYTKIKLILQHSLNN